MICCRESLKTVSVRRKVMRYEAKDFLALKDKGIDMEEIEKELDEYAKERGIT